MALLQIDFFLHALSVSTLANAEQPWVGAGGGAGYTQGCGVQPSPGHLEPEVFLQHLSDPWGTGQPDPRGHSPLLWRP